MSKTENPYRSERRNRKNGKTEEKTIMNRFPEKFTILDDLPFRKYGFIFKPDDAEELKIIYRYKKKKDRLEFLDLQEELDDELITSSEFYDKGLELTSRALVEPNIEDFDAWSRELYDDEQMLLAEVSEAAREASTKKLLGTSKE